MECFRGTCCVSAVGIQTEQRWRGYLRLLERFFATFSRRVQTCFSVVIKIVDWILQCSQFGWFEMFCFFSLSSTMQEYVQEMYVSVQTEDWKAGEAIWSVVTMSCARQPVNLLVPGQPHYMYRSSHNPKDPLLRQGSILWQLTHIWCESGAQGEKDYTVSSKSLTQVWWVRKWLTKGDGFQMPCKCCPLHTTLLSQQCERCVECWEEFRAATNNYFHHWLICQS